MRESAHDRPHAPATLVGVGAIAMWSFSGLCYGVGGRALGAMPFLCVSSALAVVTIVVFHLLLRRPIRVLFMPPPRVAVAGLVGIVVYSLLLASAMGMAAERDLAQVMLLNYLWPIWIVLLGIALLGQRRRVWAAIVGALMGITGVAVSRGAEIRHYPSAALLPHAMAAVGSVLWAAYSVLLRHWRVPSEQGGSTFQFLVLAIVAGIIALAQGAWRSPDRWGTSGLAIALFAGVGPFGLAYYGWEIGMKRGAVHVLAVLSYFIPIASAVLLGQAFNATNGPHLLPGAALIAAGAYLSHCAEPPVPGDA